MRNPSLVLLALVALAGCKRTRITPTDDTGDEPVGRGGVCEDASVCDVGLTCAHEGTCQPEGVLGTTPVGGACDNSVVCQVGLVCSAERTCALPGSLGTAGPGDPCTIEGDCAAGLDCYDQACTGFELEILERPDCPDAGTWGVEGNPYRILFRPELGQSGDVYAAPFPADWRASTGGPLLEGHPTFGALTVFGDVGADILADYEAEFRGYGANATIYLRASDLPGFDRVKIGVPEPFEGDPGDAANAARGSVAMVDLTEGSTFGSLVAAGWALRTHQPYLCDPWMAMYPADGRPLAAGHRYGVFVTDDLHGGVDAGPPESEPAFDALLAASPPDDAALVGPWESFAPARDYLAGAGIPTDHIAGGTVFTVESYDEVPAAVRGVARSVDVPTADVLHRCGLAPGPLATTDAPDRGCFGENPSFHELQARLTVPLVQAGTAPFVTRADGGNADWSNGAPSVRTFGSLELTLTIPQGTPPEGGWPIVLFAPDAGENYRSSISEGLASRWTSVSTGQQDVGFAVVSIDTWLTGPRAGEISPTWLEAFPPGIEEALLYDNPVNPVAVRDNVTQSAIDWFTVIRWLEGADPELDPLVPGGVELATDELWLVGQGLGSRALPLVAAAESNVQGVVLAGAGGLWSTALKERRDPFALEAVLSPALGDPTVDRLQPIVALGQQIIDRTEPVVHAPYVHRLADRNRDVLLVVGDEPEVGRASQRALARGLHVEQLVQDGQAALDGVNAVEAPVSANVAGSTAVAVVNGGSEPHRLLYTNPRTIQQVDAFMATSWAQGRATLPFLP